jgi:hypothetical protein
MQHCFADLWRDALINDMLLAIESQYQSTVQQLVSWIPTAMHDNAVQMHLLLAHFGTACSEHCSTRSMRVLQLIAATLAQADATSKQPLDIMARSTRHLWQLKGVDQQRSALDEVLWLFENAPIPEWYVRRS